MLKLVQNVVITGVTLAVGAGLVIAVYTAPLWMSQRD